MRDLLPFLRRWLATGEEVAFATVVATRKSAPRPVGAVLAVASSGELAGSVSAGCVENDVYREAQEVLAGDPARERTYGITDEMAFEVGLPCGGEIDVFVSRAERPLLERAIAELERGRAVTVRPEGGALELVSRPSPRIVVVGAVDTAEPVCAGARNLGWRAIVVDPRPRYGTRERVPSADEIVVQWPEEALPALELDEGTAVVVLAHDDRIDVPALGHALASSAFFVGAIGSRRTQERRRELLRDAGVDDEALERIHGPVGLDVGAEAPAEVAVAILAEILAVRNGRSGGALRERAGRIHAGV